MADPRVEKLAQVLVNYSLRIKKGDRFRIAANAVAAPLVRELYRETLKAGGLPFTRIDLDGIDELLLKYGSDEQISDIPPFLTAENEQVDAMIRIIGEGNSRSLSGVDAAKVAKRRDALRPFQEMQMRRSAEGTLNWCVTLFPTNSGAQDADMSLSDYEDFVYGACLVDQDDPVGEWEKVHTEQQRIADFLMTKDTIRLVGKDTDLTYRVGGRTWVNASGRRNFPDGEVFTGPIEDSANGVIRYSFPTIFSGREADDVRLVFKDGKVVEATAGKGQDILDSLLELDPGARYLGEVAFGLNYGITRFSRNILFDEKIGGTVHLALGAGYPDTGSTNRSALHWDMICDMREESEVYADGELIYRNGKFII
jgi:Leucyl aminopeptidase (aminopeptidase T)